MLSILFLVFTAIGSLSIVEGKHLSASPLRTVYQFPKNGTWLENISIRPNGAVLVTRVDAPELWSINPTDGTASLIHTFPKPGSVSGITEIAPDVFAVMSLDVNLSTFQPIPNSTTIWKVDFCNARRRNVPDVSVIAAPKEPLFPNGVTTFGENRDTLLITDSSLQQVWKLDIKTGAISVALKDPSMTIPEGASFPIGINGIKVWRDYVYYTSFTRGLFARVKVDAEVRPVGPYEIVADTGLSLDDFAIAADGTAYVAANPNNRILRVTANGTVSTFAGAEGSLDVAGVTACALGKGRELILYCSTDGAAAGPVNGTLVEPGKVVALQLGGHA